MLSKHLNHRRNITEQHRVFRSWQALMLERFRIRMFFVKFIEYRGAKMLGLACFKQAKRLTDAFEVVKKRLSKRRC